MKNNESPMCSANLKNSIKNKRQNILFSLCLVSLLIFLNSILCYGQETITVNLEPFTKLSVGNASKIKLTPGKGYSLTFEGSQADADKIKESVEGGELEIKGRPLGKMNLTFEKLEDIEIKGTSKVTCTEPIQADQFNIDISGTGDVSLILIVKKVNVDISGAGNLTLSGTSDKLDMDISGAGNVEAENFKTRECTADISGSGHCTVDVTDELHSNISGSGSISYKNPPARINKDISGFGHVGDDDYTFQGKDTTRFKLGDRKFLIIGGKDSLKSAKADKTGPHWAGIELGFNGFLTSENKMTPDGFDFLELNQAKSIAVNLNFFDYNIKLYKRYIMLVSGLGLTCNNYRFKNNYLLKNGENGIYGIKDTVLNYSKNKLTVSYLTLPVLLEFNTNKYEKKSFHISTGAVFGYKIGSHTKQVYSLEGNKQKSKNYDEFSINPWRVDVTARIGYRFLNLFVNYDVVSLFRKDKGPEVYPYTVGLSLAGW